MEIIQFYLSLSNQVYRKIIFICFLILATFSVHSQRMYPKIYKGFDGFVLGNSLDMYGTGIELVDSTTYNGKTEYHYINRFKPPYDLGGVKFNDVILNFDKGNKLNRIELIKVYPDLIFKDPKKECNENRTGLIEYLNKETGSRGKKLPINQCPATNGKQNDIASGLFIVTRLPEIQ